MIDYKEKHVIKHEEKKVTGIERTKEQSKYHR